MTYDRDIKWVRRVMHCMAVGNVWALMMNAWAHNWIIAIACGIWFCNVLVQLNLMKMQQVTRDRGRILESGLNAMHQAIESDGRD